MKEVKVTVGAWILLAAVLITEAWMIYSGTATAQPAGYVNTYSGGPVLLGVTNTSWGNYIAGAAGVSPTNQVPWRIDCAGCKEFSLELKMKCAATNTANIVVAIGRNNSGIADTNQMEMFTQLTVPANGTNYAVGCSNWTVNAHRWVYVCYVTNNNPTAASAVTNWTLTANTK